ncbi:MAG: hypothetical protein GXO36_00900 [Chloroflexi bacterium]|nr:hypothetical protein [Chloroflexota bacterium]
MARASALPGRSTPDETQKPPGSLRARFLRAWPWWVSFMVALLTTAPYVRGALHANAAWAFTGFLFAVDDGLSYIAKMRLGAQGAWCFRTPYTTEPALGLPAFGSYILLGHFLAPRAPYHAFLGLFQAFRLVALVGLVAALHRVLAWIFPGRPGVQSLVALWTLLGGGLGWLLYPLGWGHLAGWAPLSFYAPEAFGFLAVWGLPHLTAARGLWLYGWWAYAHRHYGRALVAAGAILLFQPLYIVPLALLWLGSTWFDRGTAGPERSRLLVLGLGFTLWTAYWGYMLWARTVDPVVRAWDAQNNVRMVPWGALALAYGPWLPWVIVGGRALAQTRPRVTRPVLLWLAAIAVLIWLPTSVQRRLLEGVWWAWGVFTAAALFVRMPSPAAQRSRAWTWLPFGLAALSPIILWTTAWRAAGHPQEPIFRPRAEVEAMEAWAREVPLAAGVLASYPSSIALPAYAPVRAPVGHPVESPAWAARRVQVRAFFQPDTPEAQRRAWLKAWRVDYLWWGPRERALGAWDPRTAAGYEPVFHQGAYWVFRVPDSEATARFP